MTYGPLLVVEDSDEDFYAIRRALGTTLPCAIVRCSTGSEVLDYFARRAADPHAVRPSLILLDLNLPGKNGFSILHHLKQDSSLCDIPVVIFSTSNNPADIERCYRASAASYVVKPLQYDHLRQVLQNLSTYWFHTVALPPRK